MTEPITWTNETRKLSDLIPWDINPRQLTEKQAEHLQKSLRKFNYAQPILIGPDNQIYDGHQRVSVMLMMPEFGPDYVVAVRVSSRELTYDEQREAVVRFNVPAGDWEWDTLANRWEVEELGDWGMEEWKIAEFMPGEPEPPDDFKEYGDDIDTEHVCPKCGYEWSGAIS